MSNNNQFQLKYIAPDRYNTKKEETEEQEDNNIDYITKLELSRQDFTNQVPSKQVNFFNDSYAGSGLLGYTYLGSSHIWLNDRLDYNPALRLRVAIHEAIHTPDEYETRLLEDWMVDFRLKSGNDNNYKEKDQEKEKIRYLNNYTNAA